MQIVQFGNNMFFLNQINLLTNNFSKGVNRIYRKLLKSKLNFGATLKCFIMTKVLTFITIVITFSKFKSFPF